MSVYLSACMSVCFVYWEQEKDCCIKSKVCEYVFCSAVTSGAVLKSRVMVTWPREFQAPSAAQLEIGHCFCVSFSFICAVYQAH